MKIPNAIKKSNVSIDEFRSWFKTSCTNAFKSKKYDVIQERIRLKYGIHVSQNEFVNYDNSVTVDFTNYTINELDEKLDNLIKSAGIYYYQHKEILSFYPLRTFLAFKDEELSFNPTNMSDTELKKFIIDYHNRFKKPVQVLLQEWYRVKFNP